MRLKRCRLTEKQQDKLLEFFVGEMTARTAADLAGEIEADESDFGGVRKGKRRRGAAGKAPVFGILKRGGRVYTKTIPMPVPRP